MKRIVSLLLAVVLVVSLLPMAVLATGEEDATPQSETGDPPTTDTTTDTTGNTGNTGSTPGTTPTGTPAHSTTNKLRNSASPVGDIDDETKTEIDLSGLTFASKIYDGKTNVNIDTTSIADWPTEAQISLSASVEDPNVGTGKKVTVTLSGDDANSYKLTGTENLKVDIVKAKVSERPDDTGKVTVLAGTHTLYKNVQRSYTLNLFQDLNLGDGCSLGTTTVTQDADNSGRFYKGTTEEGTDAEANVTLSLEGDNPTLTIASDFDHVTAGKKYLTFQVDSQNYESFFVQVPLEITELTHTVKFSGNVSQGILNPVVGEMEDQVGVPYNVATKLKENTFTRSNYTFAGWGAGNEQGVTISNAEGGGYNVTITKTEMANVTLYAQWEPATNNQPTKPTAADLLGQATASIYSEDDTDPTLSVKLADGNPTVTLSGNDVDGYTATVTFDKDFWDSIQEHLSEELCKKFAEDENRKGGTWYPEDTTDYPIPQTLTYTYSSDVGGLPSGSDNDSALSSWTASKENKQIGIRMYQYFTVTYTMDAETAPSYILNGSRQTDTVRKGENLPKYKGDTTGIGGYTFLGWYIGSNNIDPLPTKVTQDYSFIGTWRRNTFTIQFESGATDATGTTASMTVTWGDSNAKLPQCGFQRSGYRFSGWKQKGNPEAETCPAGTSVGELVGSDGTKITMVAQWEKAVDHVDFQLSGYDITKFVTQIKVTTDTENVHIYKYDGGEEVFWISCDDEDITSDTATFGADKIYYLHVMFALDEGCADGGLSTGNVLLDGRSAKSLTKPNDSTPGYIATFQLPVIRKITVKAMTKNGTIDPGKDFYAKDGEEVIFKVTPSTGYRCSTFKVDGTAQKLTKNAYELTVRKSHTVKVWFAKDSGNAKTGDDLRLIYLAAAGAISLAALTALAVVGIKKKKKK